MTNDDFQAFKALAKEYLCVPASSCATERTFSKAGQIISDRRCALKSKTVDQLLFINKNFDFGVFFIYLFFLNHR